MSILSKFLLVVAICQLVHSGFSSHEFHVLKKQLALRNSDVDQLTLPRDIQLEVLSGLVIFTLSVFLSNDKLSFLLLPGKGKLIKQNAYLQEISMNRATISNNLAGSDPYGDVTYMPNFVDVHARREQVRSWVIEHDEKHLQSEPKADPETKQDARTKSMPMHTQKSKK
ncbi:LAMI_0C04896g1_1 [Lachancea mirantina]|uniref:LAMI_0C04896g1_1 n=1 Tax=Lachancea mirantina TaxID=1230905 RepID=A0A1G4J2B4_9SACH|nr:LAMI_0C04896g1_1 [Lachancea mirantina]